jgi:ribonuclease HI
MSQAILLDNGIGQGDPLSMALYQYYNADILKIPSSLQEAAEAYIDDVILTAMAKMFTEAHKILASMMTRPGGMVEWSKRHNSSIEYSKLALIDFSHLGVKKNRPPLQLPEITVEPMQNTKYLGIVLDQNLKWGPQLAHVRGKGLKWAMQIRRLTRPTWGLTPKGARKLYVSITLPRIMYRIDVWCTPIHGKNASSSRKGSVNFIKKLTTVQRAGVLAITGGFRTSPTDTLDMHTALLPMELRVQKACHTVITCMATLPAEHPLHFLVKHSAKSQIKRHQSPLHTLTNLFSICPSKIEEIPPVCVHPKEKGSKIVCIDIPPDKEASKRADTNATEVIKIYTDGSSHNRNVRVAAILRRQGNPDRVLKHHLRTADHHTVYKAELIGILMGLHLIKTEKHNKVKCIINIDNQAALKAISSDLTKLGQHITAKILQLVKQLKQHGGNNRFGLTFRWLAGHVGITGNKDADKEAKSTAEGKSSDKQDLPPYLHKPLGHSLSNICQKHNDSIKHKWAMMWIASPRYCKLCFCDLLMPSSQKYLKHISNPRLSRTNASRIFQMRVGHMPLNYYLHKFKRVDSPCCLACRHPSETVEHFLLHCLKYAHKRWPIINQNRGSVPKLTKLLTSAKLLLPLATYMEATGRFQATSENTADS